MSIRELDMRDEHSGYPPLCCGYRRPTRCDACGCTGHAWLTVTIDAPTGDRDSPEMIAFGKTVMDHQTRAAFHRSQEFKCGEKCEACGSDEVYYAGGKS